MHFHNADPETKEAAEQALIDFAAEKGFDVTKEDLKSNVEDGKELSFEELENITGGGFGSWLKDVGRMLADWVDEMKAE